VKALTLAKIDEIRRKLDELNSLKDQLEQLANGCKGNARPDCPILDALSA
jgi:outer membrane murein-binding lipoprotein Lpp